MRAATQTSVVVLFLLLAQGHDQGQRLAEPRIRPLEPPEWTDVERTALNAVGPRSGLQRNNHVKICARNPEACRDWRAFAEYIHRSTLPRRVEHLLALRTAWLCQEDYHWGLGVPRGKQAGLTDEDIQRIPKGADAPGWSAMDATLLRAADQLHAQQFIEDATWKALAEHFTDRQLIDVILTVGEYTTSAMFDNSVGVQMEPGNARLPK